MKKYVIKRLVLLVFLLWASATLIFFLIHLIPGDPVVSILGEGANFEDIQRIRHELKLDLPLWQQYLDFNRNLIGLSFGDSIFNNRPVLANIMDYLPNTIYLATAAMSLAILLSLTMGTIAAFRENTRWDSGVTFMSSAGLAVPNFFLGPLLIILFSIKLNLLPVSGTESFRHLILPALTLGISMTAFLTRIVRTSLVTELKKPYILLARAKGLSEPKIFTRHLFRNALIPIVTTIGLQFGALLTGAIVTETVFSWQGIGILLIKSINRRDYPMVQGLIVFITFVYLIINFLVDISYPLIDPRIKYGQKKE